MHKIQVNYVSLQHIRQRSIIIERLEPDPKFEEPKFIDSLLFSRGASKIKFFIQFEDHLLSSVVLLSGN